MARWMGVALLVACGSEPAPNVEASQGAEEAPIEAEPTAPAEATEPEVWLPPGPMELWPTMAIEDEDLTETRGLGLRHDGERWIADFVHRSRSASSAHEVVVTSRTLDSQLAEVVARNIVPVRWVEVLGTVPTPAGPQLAVRAESERGGSDTNVRLHAGETLIASLGASERASEWKAFAAASAQPARAIVALVGSTQRRRPAAQLARARREYEAASAAGELVRAPSETEHLSSWLSFLVSTAARTRAHEVWRAPQQNRGAANGVEVAGVVAGLERHAGVFRQRADGGRAQLHVWVFDADSGRRVAAFEETEDELHDFVLRDGVVDGEGRLWLVGQASRGASPNHGMLYVFARDGRLVSRRHLYEGQRALLGAALVECSGAMWVIESSEARGETRARVMSVPSEGDLPDALELRGESDLRNIHARCHEDEAAATFEREAGYGFVRWATAPR